jgi:hypothetical protein
MIKIYLQTKKILDILISNHTRKAYELLNETNGIQNQVQKGSTHIIRESSDKVRLGYFY